MCSNFASQNDTRVCNAFVIQKLDRLSWSQRPMRKGSSASPGGRFWDAGAANPALLAPPQVPRAHRNVRFSRKCLPILHSFFKSIELHGDIQVGSCEVPLNGIEDVYLDSTAPHITEIEEAVAPMALTESLGQRMPPQCLLAALKMHALMHMMIGNQFPIMELHLKQMEFPWINRSGLGRVHRVRSHLTAAATLSRGLGTAGLLLGRSADHDSAHPGFIFDVFDGITDLGLDLLLLAGEAISLIASDIAN